MGNRRHNSFPRKCLDLMCEWNVLMVWVILQLFVVKVENVGINCPRSSGTLFAYPEGDLYEFEYTFDPLIKFNIDLLDRFLTSDDEVICDWQVRAKESHFASVSFSSFGLAESTGSRDGDCLAIYDGTSEDDTLLDHLCGGDEPDENYVASGRFLLLVFTQGEVTGKRFFSFTYTAIPRPKDLIIKIAAIASGTVAAVAIFFLSFKFTRGCRPCRKRCCPDQPSEEVHAERELRPLAPVTTLPASVTNIGEGNARNEQRVSQQPGSGSGQTPARRVNPPPDLTLEARGEDPLSPDDDEAPPSYDSIFGSTENSNKAG